MLSFLRKIIDKSETAPLTSPGKSDNPLHSAAEPLEKAPSVNVEPVVIAAQAIAHAQVDLPFPPGHFYSPIVDPSTLVDKQELIWSTDKTILGIDFNDANHIKILTEVFPRFMAGYTYADDLPESAELTQYSTNNSQFSWLDSRALLVFLQHFRPKRIVEIGSGFSSLLTADVNNRLLGNSAKFSCIEPYPREFLRKPIPGLSELLVQKVEDIPINYFAELAPNDILFIDSSHVSKTNSDVNYLVFEILPRLRPGVIVHIHDIFLPAEYPKDWVLNNNRSWNEQYLIRALLMYSTAFKTFFGCSYAFTKHPDLVASALANKDGSAYGGGSLWLERI